MSSFAVPRVLHDGQKIVITAPEVHVQGSVIYLQCSGPCGKIKHLELFGCRKTADGVIRNQPQCSDCRAPRARRAR